MDENHYIWEFNTFTAARTWSYSLVRKVLILSYKPLIPTEVMRLGVRRKQHAQLDAGKGRKTPYFSTDTCFDVPIGSDMNSASQTTSLLGL